MACSNAGFAHEMGRGTKIDFARALKLYERGCNLGSRTSCVDWGRTYQTGHGVAVDQGKAFPLFDAARNAGNQHGCYSLGRWWIEVKSGFKVGLPLLEESCQWGVTSACVSLGFALEDPRSGAFDPRRAVLLYERACDGGDGQGCYNAGVRAQDANNDARANAFDERACALGHWESSVRAGQRFGLGLGVPNDDAKAFALFTHACDANIASGCAQLAVLYEHGRATPVDLRRSYELSWAACQDGSGMGCTGVGWSYKLSKGVAGDAKRAAEFFGKAATWAMPRSAKNWASFCSRETGFRRWQTGRCVVRQGV
jgi:uncharacterized protein